MKQVLLTLVAGFMISAATAQGITSDITPNNSWLKIGVNMGIPVDDVSDYTSFAAGLDLKGQKMVTRHIGLGLTSGFTHFFASNNGAGVTTLPIGFMARYYQAPKGIFIGVDLGYKFIFDDFSDNGIGGFYVRPQIGYHNYDWNFFAYYDNVFRADIDGGNIGNVGIGVAYNLRFKKSGN